MCLAFAACSKEPDPQQPAANTYDFTGRRYETYTDYNSFMAGRRAYFALDFVAEANLLRYNGHDYLGEDSVWHRLDTIGQVRTYAYCVRDNCGQPWLWTYLSDEPFDNDEFYGSITHHGYEIDASESLIFYENKVYERVR